MRRIVIPLLALLLMFAAVSPAVAVPPVENSGNWANDFSLLTCEQQGFAIFDYAVGEFSEKSYFDQQGALVMVRGHEFGVDTLHREGDFSRVLASNFSDNYVWDAVAQEIKYSGSVFNIKLPTEGLLYKIAGQGIFDTQSGELRKQVGADYLDKDALCEYFAP